MTEFDQISMAKPGNRTTAVTITLRLGHLPKTRMKALPFVGHGDASDVISRGGGLRGCTLSVSERGLEERVW